MIRLLIKGRRIKCYRRHCLFILINYCLLLFAAGGGGGGSGRRTQRTIRDAIKTIQPQVFKEQLSDTSDIVGTRKLAPRTKKAMRNHLFEHLDNYFVHPGNYEKDCLNLWHIFNVICCTSGRKIAGRPLQKLVERQFDAVRREMKSKAAEDDERKSMEPLNDDLSKIRPVILVNM